MTALLVLTSALAWAADDRYAGTRYLGGRAGVRPKVDGTLLLGNEGVAFEDKKGRPLFMIPFADVVEAVATTEWNEFPANVNKTEYVRLQVAKGDVEETIVFRTGRYQSEVIAARIRFLKEKASP